MVTNARILADFLTNCKHSNYKVRLFMGSCAAV
jgi:hypothetical protein